MTLEEVMSLYGTGYAACKAVNIRPQNFDYWVQCGKIPEKQQWRLMFVSDSKLQVDKDIIERLLKHHKK